MDPFYFGDRGRPLFGIYDPPTQQAVRDAAILMCYPIGHEQIVSHRAFTQLAMRLSAAGFPVLRFDFYGCGDSSGACEDGSPERWLRDIPAAIGSLRLRSSCRTLGIVGCRFGATLAMLAGADREDIASMVLWDPIVNGAAYIKELAGRHQQMLQHTHVAAGGPPPPDAPREFLGIALGNTAIDEILAVDALTLPHRPAADVLVIDSDANNSSEGLRQHLTAVGSSVEHQLLPVENAWTWIEDVNKVLVPQNVMTAIVSWIAQRHA